MINLTISARSKNISIQEFLILNFSTIRYDCIDSLFGFSGPCKLYGGRTYNGPELIDDDLNWMYANNIGYRIPLTSYFFTEEMYNESRPFLDKHYRQGNSIIITKDALAKRIKKDYPLYKIEASVIKETDNLDKLYKRLELYDTIVPLPEAFNNNYELLESIKYKDRVRLFINMGCSYMCPARLCYKSFSKNNRGDPYSFECSQRNGYIPQGMIGFDIDKYISLGFNKFKMLRPKDPTTKLTTGY